MNLYHNTGDVTIYNGKALNLLRWLDAGSVSLAFLDPPYFKVKPLWWDRQWKDSDSFLNWMGQICIEVKRVLAPNGSLYLCASPAMSYRVEGVLREHFNVLNVIRWQKSDGTFSRADVTGYRTWLAAWEAVIFAEQWGADGDAMNKSGYLSQSDKLRGSVFEPIRAYLDGERRRAGFVGKDADRKMRQMLGVSLKGGGLLSHYWGRAQWALPTKEHYEKLQELFNNGNPGEYLHRDYEDLRREYKELRREYKELRRPFHPTRNLHRDDWHYAQVEANDTKHETEKPLPMLLDIVETSSRPGDLVLDCFLGRGPTAIAARRLGRRFIGGDVQKQWCAATVARLKEASGEFHIKARRDKAQETPAGQLELFTGG